MEKHNILTFKEPTTIDGFSETMMNNGQLYSSKFYAIALLHTILYGKSIGEVGKKIILDTKQDFPELTAEIDSILEERFNIVVS